MEEGGYDFPDEAKDTDPLRPDTGDDDDEGEEWTWWANLSEEQKQEYRQRWAQEVQDTTQPFEPGATSTPSQAGEQIPLDPITREPTEKQGLNTDETSLNEGNTQGRRMLTTADLAFEEIKRSEFPNADRNQLDFRYEPKPKSGGAIIEVKYKTREKWYPLFTKSRGASEKTPNTSLPKEIKTALGTSTTEEVNETNAVLEANRKEMEAKQKELQQNEQRAAEKQELRRELEALGNRTKDIVDQMQELEDAHGPLDKEAIQRLKNEKRAVEAEHQAKRKQFDNAQKAAQQADKLRKDIDKIKLDSRGLERRREELRGRQDSVKTLDELKQNREELDRQDAEDKRIIEDENASPSERAAAGDRVTERAGERARVNTEIEARERARPLRERVREIFKKYGWTLQAIVLAAGITISAVVLATMNGLAKATKAIGNGLKELAKKAAAALPGLIGTIVSFLFKTAGSVISFLGEHAWLLILAVVAFLVERVTKRARKS